VAEETDTLIWTVNHGGGLVCATSTKSMRMFYNIVRLSKVIIFLEVYKQVIYHPAVLISISSV
jgi:hypothetical protein